MISVFFGYVEAGLGVFFFLFCITNTLWMRAHSKKPEKTSGPKVSVLVPARNEEDYIGKCLDSLLNQTYENYDILVLNDNSEDKTLEILREYRRNHPQKIKYYDGLPLPSDWQGKCYAMHQLVSHADGEYLLFTDADTIHFPDSIAVAVANLEGNNADLISGYIHQTIGTLGEKLTVPLMYMLTNFILLMPLDKIFHNPMFAAAIGQYIAVRASSFKAIGGYETVKKMTTEDMYLARKFKTAGYKTLFVDVHHVATCRMYNSYKAAINGIGKNIFDFFEKRTIVLFVIFFAVLIFMAFPPYLGLFQVIAHIVLGTRIDSLTICLILHTVFIFLTWLLLFITQKLPRHIAFMYPLLFVNLMFMAVHSWYKSVFGGGYEWKGRSIK